MHNWVGLATLDGLLRWLDANRTQLSWSPRLPLQADGGAKTAFYIHGGLQLRAGQISHGKPYVCQQAGWTSGLGGQGSCRSNWTQARDGLCYGLPNPNPLDWLQALHTCNDIGAQLISVLASVPTLENASLTGSFRCFSLCLWSSFWTLWMYTAFWESLT